MMEKLIKDIEKYEAHILTDEEGKIVKRETLAEHTTLTASYFERIWSGKGMDAMLERFCQQVLKGISADAKAFLDELILGIPIFHDFGKINPDFQKNKMKNKQISGKNAFSYVSSRHSIISSVIYLDYYLDKLKTLDVEKCEKKEIRRLITLHAYILERHHSDLNEFSRFMESLTSENGNDVVQVLAEGKCDVYQKDFSLHGKKVNSLLQEIRKQNAQDRERQECIGIYIYVKMLYSVLVSSDFYATSEFMSGTQITQLGDIDDISQWMKIYEDTKLMQTIRKYQREEYPKSKEALRVSRDINQLRTEMLIDAELVLKENITENLFYLEAPTGSGKSNTAMDLSFQMMKEDTRLKKIYYIYPFNTLVEQNLQSLKKVFGGEQSVMDNIAVVNSLTPIKMTKHEKKKESESEDTMCYQKALLDRQFLNYPMILSTHVSMFDTMFGDTKESAFGFHQLMNSVIVLDEIQSYKNTIWGEIICFLKGFAYLLNIKILIMSATLPDLDLLSADTYHAVKLMKDRDKYFSNPCFKERVKVSYELLKESGEEAAEDLLAEHVRHLAESGKKILVEFIKKNSAAHFFSKLKEMEEISCDVEYMSGDDSLMERGRILDKIKNAKSAIILIATQVIEAGVDIDMDIGYKNISKLDSEEQFMGRINRSCLREGIVYFFKMDDGKSIYREDIRAEKMFTLENEAIHDFLASKDFAGYYEQILQVLKRNYNDQTGKGGLQHFFTEEVGKVDFPQVKKRMQLIAEDDWSMSVYLARVLENENGDKIDGAALWCEYVELLQDFSTDYAEKRVKLSKVTSQMNYFIYQIKRNYNLTYNDKVGDIYFIEDGEQYFENGKLNREKIQGEIGEFVDFI
ncbi:MAG: CRISPR-associated helicase Cas3' [Hespellia sp.]|nr:CRISPR-associated helicase Cas3' [Hespellia sp.]